MLSWKKEEILDKKDIRCIIVGGAKLVLPIYYITLRKRIMKYLKQFLLILCITFVGELVKYVLPLPIPASIYGMVILFVGLMTGHIKLSSVKEVGKFLIEIMPVMFIPAGVGLMVSWNVLKPLLIPVGIITFVSFVAVAVATGKHLSGCLRKMRGKTMNEFLENSLFAGVTISLLAYMAGAFLKKKFKIALLNPLLISIILSIVVLVTADIDYDVYNAGASYLSWFLTPATVCLAIPLYEQWQLLKKNWKAVMFGILAGTLTSGVTVFMLAKFMSLSHTEYVTLLPKSITTAIGMGLSEELGGYVTITVAVIVVTGVVGNMFGELVCKLFRITHPIAKGLAFGSSSHAIGTAKAMELGEIEGAMSSLAIAVTGILTVVFSPLFMKFI